MKKIFLLVITLLISLNAQTLFEIKDASDNPVFSISNDGLRVFNLGDTLMVISATEIKAFIAKSKDRALSRSFSVTTSTTGKGTDEVVNIDSDGLRVYSENDKLMDITGSNITAYIDSSSTKALSRSFSVTTSTTGKAGADVLEITTDATKMREGGGDQYTDFSPENIFLGLNAGINTAPSTIWGLNNVFIGNNAGILNTDGADNIFIGDSSGVANISGFKNLFIGSNAGKSNTIGLSNIFLGQQAGELNEDGNFNIYLGYAAGIKNISGSGNTYIGLSAGSFATSDYNTFVGTQSGNFCDSGNQNSMFGYRAGKSIGSGNSNVMFGYVAGLTIASGDSNVFIGSEAGRMLPSGSGNVFLGFQAGSGLYSDLDNTLIIESGYGGGDNWNNALIYGQFDEDKLKFNALVGINAVQSSVYGLTVSGGSSTEYSALFYKGAYTYGSFISGSDKRWKTNVETIESSLDKVVKLRGVTFDWNNTKYPDKEFSNRKQIGVIAQELEEVFPELVIEDEDGYRGVDYSKITAVLIEAIKELDKKTDEIEYLKSEIEEIKRSLK